ncbi:hypothetical protein SKAU_G00313230 [Synaphobranchus kaupii]|uniref:Uncharacterized protein n=1 Tax=Synaphobranchus kaupii TaxID=118154 RepID=A0A9Q1ESA4_SYNKA|nr:hypothetical protein SKAU_G00313230 [Synaphobranchus kaupii]
MLVERPALWCRVLEGISRAGESRGPHCTLGRGSALRVGGEGEHGHCRLHKNHKMCQGKVAIAERGVGIKGPGNATVTSDVGFTVRRLLFTRDKRERTAKGREGSSSSCGRASHPSARLVSCLDKLVETRQLRADIHHLPRPLPDPTQLRQQRRSSTFQGGVYTAED